MRFILLVVLSACSGGLASSVDPSVIGATVSFTDPSGVQRVEQAWLSTWRREGPSCVGATWYGFGNNDFDAEFVISDSGGPVVFDPGFAPSSWRDAPEQLFLHGGTGTLIALDDVHLEYEISRGEVHYRGGVLDEDFSYPQPAAITILVEGPIGELQPSPRGGEAGFATDIAGNALCSGDDRNW